MDVIYRRVDDDFLDPLVFRSDSALGVAGVINAWRAGNVAMVNAPGSGIADDKAVYPYVPDIIRYYLGEQPILNNVPTYQMTNVKDREYVFDNMERMVIKAVGESGGYGMLMGPSSTPALRKEFMDLMQENPAQLHRPAGGLPVAACLLHGRRTGGAPPGSAPFHHLWRGDRGGAGRTDQGGLRKGSLVVNSSQGGGSKDTWVLAE